MREIYEVYETEEQGVFLKIKDLDVGDQFDDYLAGEIYVLSDVSHHDEHVEFSFGRAASVSKVQQLIEEFHSRTANP